MGKKDNGVNVKYCKQLGLLPCYNCQDIDNSSKYTCSIAYYVGDVKRFVDSGETNNAAYIKAGLLKLLRYNFWAERNDPYYIAAVKIAYPEYKEWFERMMMLK